MGLQLAAHGRTQEEMSVHGLNGVGLQMVMSVSGLNRVELQMVIHEMRVCIKDFFQKKSFQQLSHFQVQVCRMDLVICVWSLYIYIDTTEQILGLLW